MKSYITREKRIELIDWIVEECINYDFSYYTMHLAITIMDKYLFANYKERSNFKHIAIVCLVLASKIEEVKYMGLVTASKIIKINNDKLIKLEEKIFKYLQFNLYQKTIITYFLINDFITKNDYYFACYIASTLLLDFDLTQLNFKELASQIKKFCENIKYKLESMDVWINEDPIYYFCYDYWKKTNISQNNIKKYFDKQEYNICNIECPQINFIDNIKNNINNNKTKKIKINGDNISNNKFILYSDEIMNNCIICDYLGKGASSIVKHIQIKNKKIAFKQFSYEDNRKNGIEYYILREINTLRKLEHPNIIKIDGCYFDSINKKIGIGLELMDKTLFNIIQCEQISQYTKEKYILQLLNGLKYMHDNEFMHRDLSIWNILIKKEELKISDMGSSRRFRDTDYLIPLSNDICTIYFRPIEILLKKKTYCSKIDIWSCACVITYILQETILFDSNDEQKILNNIFEILGTPSGEEIDNWLGFNSTFVKSTRKGIIDLDKNFSREADIIYKMLEYLPNKRINIDESLKLFSNIYGNQYI